MLMEGIWNRSTLVGILARTTERAICVIRSYLRGTRVSSYKSKHTSIITLTNSQRISPQVNLKITFKTSILPHEINPSPLQRTNNSPPSHSLRKTSPPSPFPPTPPIRHPPRPRRHRNPRNPPRKHIPRLLRASNRFRKTSYFTQTTRRSGSQDHSSGAREYTSTSRTEGWDIRLVTVSERMGGGTFVGCIIGTRGIGFMGWI